jgi:multiple sugar transport system substrate-binding protein
MEGRRKRVLAVLLVVLAVSAVAVTAASAKRVAGTLNIYGYGPGDDVQENRAAYAKDQLSGTTINRPAGDFNDQSFVTRLASGDVPDLVRMSRSRVPQYASKGVLSRASTAPAPSGR